MQKIWIYVLIFCIDMFAPLLISWNNLSIFKWNNTYLHLYEITCLCVYEIGKTQKNSNSFLKGHKDSKRHWITFFSLFLFFSFDILRSIRTFWNITTCKVFFFWEDSELGSTSNKFAVWNYLFLRPTTIAHLT